jgi:periplasmic protein TonB
MKWYFNKLFMGFMSIVFMFLILNSCSDKSAGGDANTSQKIAGNEQGNKSHADLGNNKIDQDTIYESFNIDVQPFFHGGDEALTDYIQARIQYPKEAKNNGIEGTVYIRFVVTKNGTIGETQIMRTVDPNLEMEAIRVIRNLPKWTPGKKDGKHVNVWFIIPVKFKLQ